MSAFLDKPKQPDRERQANPYDALLFAILGQDAGLLQAAIERGADVNATAPNGTQPIVLAAVEGDAQVFDLLLAAGADVNRPDQTGGMTALHAAATKGHAAIVQRLIAHRAALDAPLGDAPLTALSLAFRRDHRHIVRLLLEAGADPNVSISSPSDPPDQQGITPLIYAASTRDVEMLTLLIRAGADVNRPKTDGLTPLMCAVFSGQIAHVQQLVEAGADVGAVNAADPSEPYSAQDLAQSLGHIEVANYLLRKGSHARDDQ
jgi:ankyrin repeat protein